MGATALMVENHTRIYWIGRRDLRLGFSGERGFDSASSRYTVARARQYGGSGGIDR